MNKTRHMKILLSTYSCGPDRGSEPGVGWNAAMEMAKYAETHVLTCFEFKRQIEEKMAGGMLPPNLHFHFYEILGGAFWWRHCKMHGIRIHYYLWQCLAAREVARLNAKYHFTSAQHLTFVKYNSPSCLRAAGIPYILGPVGAAEETPPPLLAGYPLRGKLFEFLRHVEKRFGEKDPLVRRTIRNAAIVLATTKLAGDRMAAICPAQRIALCGDVALSAEDAAELALSHRSARQSGIVFFFGLGRLVALKGYNIFLRAFAKASLQNARLVLVGDGPERRRLETLAETLGMADRLKITGFLPRKEALSEMSKCDVMVHPSHHDSGGWACVEAMAAGKPVICMDYGGPGANITDETGIKVPVGSEESVVAAMADAMKKLADPVVRETMSTAAKKRVSAFYTWPKRIEYYLSIHRELSRNDAL